MIALALALYLYLASHIAIGEATATPCAECAVQQ